MLNLWILKYGTAGFPIKNVRIKLNKNNPLGLIEKIKSLRLMCFFISKFHEINILIIIDAVFAKKNDLVPILREWIK